MTEQAVVQWVTDYGYFGIFFLLIFGIIGLPVPDEWLLVISGYLAFKNVLGFVPTVGRCPRKRGRSHHELCPRPDLQRLHGPAIRALVVDRR